MSTKTYTSEQLAEAIQLVQQHGTITEAARALGIPRNTFDNRYQRAVAAGFAGTKPVLPGYELKTVSTQRNADGETEREWIKQAKAPGEAFELPAGHSVKGLSVLTDSEGRTIAQWTKTKVEPSEIDLLEAAKEALIGFDAKAELVPPPFSSESDLATVYVVSDVHVGLLSWKPETGAGWDLRIAERAINAAVSRLVDLSPPSKQAVVLGLGDLLHSDFYSNRTEQSGNALDVDGRFPKVAQAAVRLVCSMVAKALCKHDRVIVRLLPGNHDRHAAIWVSIALSMFYDNDSRVVVDTDPGYFWWWSWGKTLLGATHGDAAKMEDLPLLMATTNPEAWGASTWRSVYTGHRHTKTGIEKSGVTVESFQSPAPPDAWHAQQGYRATRSLSSITLHKDNGEMARNKVHIV